MPERLLLSIPEVAEAMGIGRSSVYMLLDTGALASLKVGKLRRISRSELERFIHQRETATTTEPAASPAIPEVA